MNFLARGIDDQEARHAAAAEAEERWLRERAGIDPAERLASWDAWVRRVLAEALVWPADAARREKLLAQCAAEMTVLARQLRGRGWLLDGKVLAAHVQACLAPIAKAQRAGKVGDFWPYFRAAVSRYVGANAEEIQQQAKRTGADEGAQSIGALLGGLRVLRGDGALSMVELLTTRAGEVAVAKTESLREKQARVRAARKADATQRQLW
ncbi:MAG: hypothetical protein JNK23_10410 [Opitutaceae bacterium]|nr:hypothetical protein [Opitutaceae bacterium]